MGNNQFKIGPIQGLIDFQKAFEPVFPYVACTLSLIGIVGNIVNTAVLTRKYMTSSMSLMLASIAISDTLTNISMMSVFLIRFRYSCDHVIPISEIRLLMASVVTGLYFHSVSIWFAVSCAVFRYIAIRFPLYAQKYCNISRARCAIISIMISVSVSCVLYATSLKIAQIPYMDKNKNCTLNWIHFQKDTADEIILFKIHLWIQAVFHRILPCFVLSLLSFMLFREMKKADDTRKMMTDCSSQNDHHHPSSHTSQIHSHNRMTTKMLLTVVILFILTEVPHGILLFLSGLEDTFLFNVYIPLGDLIDIITLLNDGLNFAIYCSMSSKFRKTFRRLFCFFTIFSRPKS